MHIKIEEFTFRFGTVFLVKIYGHADYDVRQFRGKSHLGTAVLQCAGTRM
jgi:hypothetical protein